MNAVSAAEIARIRAATVETMRDTCQLGTDTVATSGIYATETIAYGSTIACGFEPDVGMGKGEALGSQAPMNSGTLRLPLATTVGETNRVKLISRLGATLSPSPVYRVVGAAQMGAADIILKLEAITATGTG